MRTSRLSYSKVSSNPYADTFAAAKSTLSGRCCERSVLLFEVETHF